MQSIKINRKINMLQWLNTHVGTDWATYQGWILGIAGVALTIYGYYRATPALNDKTRNTKIKQTAKHVQGALSLAGRDVNNITNNNYDSVDENALLLKIKHDHNLKIIEEILILLPYEETIEQADLSYLVGMLLKFSQNLEGAEKYKDEKYRLFNASVNDSKNAFIDSVESFVNSYLGFLSVDHIEKEPHRLDLPYDWRNKGEESEKKYRQHQSNMRETSGLMIERYKDFVKTFKEQDFITNKL